MSARRLIRLGVLRSPTLALPPTWISLFLTRISNLLSDTLSVCPLGLCNFWNRSNTELPQMMVEMFVDQNSPLLRRHASEKAMGIVGASCGAKEVTRSISPFSRSRSARKSRSSSTLKPGTVGRIPKHGLVVAESLRFDESPDHPSDQHARWPHLTQGLLHTLAAVRYRLGRIHLAPFRSLSGRRREILCLISWLVSGSKMFRMQPVLLAEIGTQVRGNDTVNFFIWVVSAEKEGQPEPPDRCSIRFFKLPHWRDPSLTASPHSKKSRPSG